MNVMNVNKIKVGMISFSLMGKHMIPNSINNFELIPDIGSVN